MSRRIFFSFHYKADIWRVNTVRNSDVTKNGVHQSGYWDHSLWEETKKRGDLALRNLIAEGMKNTTVTVVLAGTETWKRPWVQYELVKSLERGNGLLSIQIHNVKNQDSRIATEGPNPLSRLYYRILKDGKTVQTWHWDGDWKEYSRIKIASLSQNAKNRREGKLSDISIAFDWVTNDGYNNFAKWVEKAAKAAGH